ncbi:16405_t:CDS:2, partial [Acaulospora colombiana]
RLGGRFGGVVEEGVQDDTIEYKIKMESIEGHRVDEESEWKLFDTRLLAKRGTSTGGQKDFFVRTLMSRLNIGEKKLPIKNCGQKGDSAPQGMRRNDGEDELDLEFVKRSSEERKRKERSDSGTIRNGYYRGLTDVLVSGSSPYEGWMMEERCTNEGQTRR